MYEMYPDTWGSEHDSRPADLASAPARRRVRREHRIQPVIAEPRAETVDGRPRPL